MSRATRVLLMTMIGMLAMSLALEAGEHRRGCLWGWWPGGGTSCCACPDDYVCQPLPCPPPLSCAAPYCYCAKPMPIVPCNAFCCDNFYCGKPLPPWPCNCEPWYRCVPTSCGTAAAKCLPPPAERISK